MDHRAFFHIRRRDGPHVFDHRHRYRRHFHIGLIFLCCVHLSHGSGGLHPRRVILAIQQRADVEGIGNNEAQGLIGGGVFLEDVEEFPVKGIADQEGAAALNVEDRSHGIPTAEFHGQKIGKILIIVHRLPVRQAQEFGDRPGQFAFLDPKGRRQGVKIGCFRLQ